MFYCDPCRIEKNLPHRLLQSFGNCEICNQQGPCYSDGKEGPQRQAEEEPALRGRRVQITRDAD
jgi:hypothetical protein